MESEAASGSNTSRRPRLWTSFVSLRERLSAVPLAACPRAHLQRKHGGEPFSRRFCSRLTGAGSRARASDPSLPCARSERRDALSRPSDSLRPLSSLSRQRAPRGRQRPSGCDSIRNARLIDCRIDSRPKAISFLVLLGYARSSPFTFTPGDRGPPPNRSVSLTREPKLRRMSKRTGSHRPLLFSQALPPKLDRTALFKALPSG